MVFRPGKSAPPADIQLTGAPDPSQLLSLIMPRRQAPARGKRGILTAYHSAPMFHACARRVAESMAQMDWFVESPDGILIEDHPFNGLIAAPNPVMPGYMYRQLQQLYQDLLGESFDIMFRTENGGLELWPVPPTAMTAKDEGRWELKLGDFRETFEAHEVLHLKSPDLLNPYRRGTGVGRVLADEVETSEYISKHVKAQFYNGARPDLILRLPGANEEAQRRFKQEWINRFQGVEKGGAPAIFGDDADDMIVEEISRSLADMESAELKELEDQLIRRVWGIPPEIMGQVESSNRATIHISIEIMARFVQIPRAKFWRSCWNHWLMPLIDDDREARVDFVSPVPEDRDARREKMAETPWAFTVNEHREAVGLPPREGGDVYMRQPGQDEFEPAGEIIADVPEADSAPEGRGGPDNVIRLPWVRDDTQPHCCGSIPAYIKQTDETLDDLDLDDERARQAAEALEVEPLEAELSPEVEEVMEDFVRETFDEFPVEIDGAELFLAVRPAVREHVEEFGAQKVVGINETTRRQIAETVDRGLTEGLNPRDIASEIDTYVEERIPNRGEVIARTETLQSQNVARHETFAASGLVEVERWLTTTDGRERRPHFLLDGQEVDLEEDFVIPSGEFANASAPHPGAFGIPDLDIQCRCGIRAVFPEIDDILDRVPGDDEIIQKLIRGFDTTSDQLQRAVLRVMRRQFREQFWPAYAEIFGFEHEELRSAS